MKNNHILPDCCCPDNRKIGGRPPTASERTCGSEGPVGGTNGVLHMLPPPSFTLSFSIALLISVCVCVGVFRGRCSLGTRGQSRVRLKKTQDLNCTPSRASGKLGGRTEAAFTP